MNEPFFDPDICAGFRLVETGMAIQVHEWRGGLKPPSVSYFSTREQAVLAIEAAMPAHIVWRQEQVGATGAVATIFVPSEAGMRRLGLAPLSGVVAVPWGGDGWHVYYEGNLYDASNLRRWTDRVKNAAGRLFKRYPTVAQAYLATLLAEEFTAVGTITDDYRIEITDPQTVQAFLAQDSVGA